MKWFLCSLLRKRQKPWAFQPPACALITSGKLPATKVGNAWVIDEAFVARRAEQNPKAGRPRKAERGESRGSAPEVAAEPSAFTPHELFLACKGCFESRPSSSLVKEAATPEEASFYLAVSDFFIKQRQAALVENGVY